MGRRERVLGDGVGIDRWGGAFELKEDGTILVLAEDVRRADQPAEGAEDAVDAKTETETEHLKKF
jgi:hypothetical protein